MALLVCSDSYSFESQSRNGASVRGGLCECERDQQIPMGLLLFLRSHTGILIMQSDVISRGSVLLSNIGSVLISMCCSKMTLNWISLTSYKESDHNHHICFDKILTH